MKKINLEIVGITCMVLAVIMVFVLIFAVATWEAKSSNGRFRMVEEFNGGCVFVDTETGIGYGQLYGAGSVFPLYDENGNHYRPNGWRDY